MKAEVYPTEKIERLKENLEKRVESIEEEEGKLVIQLEDSDLLDRIPGIERYKLNGERREGLGGSPVYEQAYAKIDSREDAARAFLATIMGYDLRILNTDREWDYRNLKRYNPDIKHLNFSEPKEVLEIEKALFDHGSLEKIDIDIEQDEINVIYRKMLT